MQVLLKIICLPSLTQYIDFIFFFSFRNIFLLAYLLVGMFVLSLGGLIRQLSRQGSSNRSRIDDYFGTDDDDSDNIFNFSSTTNWNIFSQPSSSEPQPYRINDISGSLLHPPRVRPRFKVSIVNNGHKVEFEDNHFYCLKIL